MPLVRYELRSELRLANPQLYRTARKDDSEAVLEGVAMAALVGIVRQLGDLAEYVFFFSVCLSLTYTHISYTFSQCWRRSSSDRSLSLRSISQQTSDGFCIPNPLLWIQWMLEAFGEEEEFYRVCCNACQEWSGLMVVCLLVSQHHGWCTFISHLEKKHAGIWWIGVGLQICSWDFQWFTWWSDVDYGVLPWVESKSVETRNRSSERGEIFAIRSYSLPAHLLTR